MSSGRQPPHFYIGRRWTEASPCVIMSDAMKTLSDGMRTALVIVLPLAVWGQAPDREAQARALRPAETAARRRAVLDGLERRARAALARIPHALTSEEAERQRGPLRERLSQSLGHRKLPWPPDLRARVTGVLRRPGYRIEKVVFQSLPGVWVPAHLYVPDEVGGPAPAILFYNGHWWADSKSRPDFQAFCINMARMGFAVFSFDPFGQGERGVSARDHRRTEALLVGLSQQGIAEYETRCALDYLLARPEVDRDRVGMTGASGGGYNTWITAALDDRIAVAVPVVGTSEFFDQIRVTRPLDWYQANEHCHFVPGLIRYANNHELLAMIAPRPLMIIAAAEDQSFPVGGVRAVHDYGRALYGAMGAGARIGLFVDSREGHGYQQAKREAAYGWFLRWLKGQGDGGAVPEPPTETLPFDAPELRCFEDGRKAPAGPGVIGAVRRLAVGLPSPAGARPLDEIMGGSPAAAGLTVRLEPRGIQRVVLATEPGIDVPAVVWRPEPPGSAPESGVLVAVDDRGKEALAADPIVDEALRRRWMVWAADPRGIGELALEQPGWAFAVSLLLGENFVWRQGWDIRRVAEAAADSGRRKVGLYARGHNATLAATYAMAAGSGRAPAWALLRGGFVSFRQFFERPGSLAASYRLLPADDRTQRRAAFDEEIPHAYFPFGALEAFDLPQLLTGARTQVSLVEPINGDWQTIGRNDVPAPLRDRVTTMERFLGADW